MSDDIRLDLSVLYAVVVRNGDKNEIADLLKLKSRQLLDWGEGYRQISFNKQFDDIGYHHWMLISEPILDWNFILCDNFYDLKYALTCCDDLNKQYEPVYWFVIDTHSGEYKFVKFSNRVIERFFERDANGNTGEFGDLLPEEININQESREHDYFYAFEVAKRILRANEWADNRTLFQTPVMIGKRYPKEIERYSSIYIEPIDSEKHPSIITDEDDFPF